MVNLLFKRVKFILLCASPLFSYVTANIQGQLGNQMFQVAAATAYAIDHQCDALFPALKTAINADLNLRYIFHRVNTHALPREPILFKEKAYDVFTQIPFADGVDLCIDGYFQFEKYFAHHADKIRALFAPTEDIVQEIERKYGDLLRKDTVAIHVRTFFPDSIDPNQGIGRTNWDYYLEAMEEFPKDFTFLIFSDAPGWVREHFPKVRKNIYFIDNNPHYLDFYLMSLCKHQVVSPRSTFSWWAAWLNPNPEKIVVRANFGDIPDESFPPSWKTVPKKYTIEFCLPHTLTSLWLKQEFLERLKNAFKIETFVETGTYLGNTTDEASWVFPIVHSIELSHELASSAKARFASQEHVHIHEADSGNCLIDLTPTLQEPILFYLDGHYSGPGTAKGEENAPLLRELKAIALAKKSESVILIDDIRLFQASKTAEAIQGTAMDNLPDLEDIVKALLKINPKYEICFLGDTLLAFPKNSGIVVSPVVKACATHRLASFGGERDLKAAYWTIGHAKASEKEALLEYYSVFAPVELKYGLPSFGTYWYGLIVEAEGDVEGAKKLYKESLLD